MVLKGDLSPEANGRRSLSTEASHSHVHYHSLFLICEWPIVIEVTHRHPDNGSQRIGASSTPRRFFHRDVTVGGDPRSIRDRRLLNGA